MSILKVFGGRSNRPLAQKIADSIGVPLGDCEIRSFSDGELWVKYGENIRGCDVYIVQSTNPPAENLMELLIMTDAAKRASARKGRSTAWTISPSTWASCCLHQTRPTRKS